MSPLPTPEPVLTRAEINRQNAQHSTGPRTPEGKNRVRTNAIKHNLSGKEMHLEAAELDAYETLTNKLLNSYKPVTEEETGILYAIRDAQWRLNSIPALHQNLMTLSTEEHFDQFQEIAHSPSQQRSMAQISGYRANSRLFEQFSRHEGRLQRSIAALTTRLFNLMDFRERTRQLAAAKAKQSQSTKQTQPAAPKTYSPLTIPSPSDYELTPEQRRPDLSNISQMMKRSALQQSAPQKGVQPAIYG